MSNFDFNKSSVPGSKQPYILSTQEDYDMINYFIDLGIRQFNKEYKDKNYWTFFKLNNIESQVVSGIIYYIHVLLGKTDCLKSNEIKTCLFTGINKNITIEVIIVPWENRGSIKLLYSA